MKSSNLNKQKGGFLLESIISALVVALFSVTLIGSQMASMNDSRSASSYFEAMNLINFMVDRIRANEELATFPATGAYSASSSPGGSACEICLDAQETRNRDLILWYDLINQKENDGFFSNTAAEITWDGSSYTITISWDQYHSQSYTALLFPSGETRTVSMEVLL